MICWVWGLEVFRMIYIFTVFRDSTTPSRALANRHQAESTISFRNFCYMYRPISRFLMSENITETLRSTYFLLNSGITQQKGNKSNSDDGERKSQENPQRVAVLLLRNPPHGLICGLWSGNIFPAEGAVLVSTFYSRRICPPPYHSTDPRKDTLFLPCPPDDGTKGPIEALIKKLKA